MSAVKPGDPKWMPDSASSKCLVCAQEFGFFGKKHHCRLCGFIVCKACSAHEKEIEGKKERVCKPCFEGKGDQDRKDYPITLVFNGMTSNKGKIFWGAFDYRAADNFPPNEDGHDVGHGEIDLSDAKEVKDKAGGLTYSISTTCNFPQTVVAVTGFHSELGLNHIRTGTFGIPKDGVFVSKDGFNTFGAPKFKDCCMMVDKESTWEMNIKYYLTGATETLETTDVKIPVTEGAKMGLKYESLGSSKALVVKGVESDGVFAAWNKANEGNKIQDGDFLLKIEGDSVQDKPTKEVVEQLSSLLKAGKELSLQFGRVVPQP